MFSFQIKETEKNSTKMNQNQNQSKQMSRLSPLAEPFMLNRSSYKPSFSPKPCVNNSLDHCDDDPFSSLLDSFRNSNLGSKGHTVPFDDTLTATTLLVEADTQTQESSLFEQYPFLELPKIGDFDGVNVSHFDASLLTNSPGKGNDVGYGRQEGEFRQFGNGNDVGNSAGNASRFQKVSGGIFEKSTGTIEAKDILSNSEGTLQATDESSSLLISGSKVAPLKLSSAKSTPQHQFLNNLGDSDTDVDSPCWKGKMSLSLTPPEIAGSVQFHHAERATEKHNSLNPLAPQFFPGIRYIKDDFMSSDTSVPVTTTTSLFSGEDILMKTVMEESSVMSNKGAELQHFSDIVYGREKAFNMVNPKSSSVAPVLNSNYTMTRSSSKEECKTSKGKLVTIGNVDDSVKGTKYTKDSRSSSEVLRAKSHSSTFPSSSSQVNDVTDLLKTFEGFSKSLIGSPKPDVGIMVNTMHVLSELLAQVCEDSLDSYGDHDPNMIMIPQIITNLNDFSTKIGSQRISTLDSHSTTASGPFYLNDLNDFSRKIGGQIINNLNDSHSTTANLTKGLEMASVETLAVPLPHQLYLQNDYMGKNTVSKVIGKSGQSSFASRGDEVTKKGNEISQLQVIQRSLGKSLDFGNQVPPEASVFLNLWLDSEAERCFRKYKTYHWLMEAGADVNCQNVAELWR